MLSAKSVSHIIHPADTVAALEVKIKARLAAMSSGQRLYEMKLLQDQYLDYDQTIWSDAEIKRHIYRRWLEKNEAHHDTQQR